MSLTRAPVAAPQQSPEAPAFHPGLTSGLYVDRAGPGGLVGLQGSLGNDFLKMLAGLGSTTLPALESGVGDLADGAAGLFGDMPLAGDMAQALAADTKARTQAGVGFARGGLDLATGLVGLASDPGAALAGVGELLGHTPGMMSCFRGLDGLAAWADGEGTLGAAALAPFDQGRDWAEMERFWTGFGGNLLAPYKEALDSGRPFEAYGRASFEVLSNLTGGAGGGTAGVKGLRWVDELAGGARLGEAGVDASRLAGWAGNKLTEAHLDELFGRIGEAMGAHPKLAGFDAGAARGSIRLRESALHDANVAGTLMHQNPGLSQAEAVAMAKHFPAYENAGHIFLSDRIAPDLAHEVLQHEALHTVAAEAWRAPGAKAVNEGVTQYLTETLLGRPGTAYPEHVAAVKGMVPHVGHDGILEQFLRGSPEALRAMLDQVSAGAGDELFKVLDEAQLDMMADQRVHVAGSLGGRR